MRPNFIQIIFTSGARLALNAAQDAGAWVKVAPYGRFPTVDKKYVQVFNADAAAEVVSWFYGFTQKMKRVLGINCVPGFLGHPDFAPTQWPKRVQLNDVTALRVGDDGLYAQFDWNKEGRTVINAGKHVFPSVAWDCDQMEGSNEIIPARLLSIGFWKTPNIKGVDPVLAINAEPDAPEPDLAPPTQPETKTQTDTTTMLLQKLIAALVALGFMKPDQTSEEDATTGLDQCVTEFNAMKQKLTDAGCAKTQAETDKAAAEAAKTKADEALTQVNAQLVTANASLAKARELLISGTITHALETGRISKADEEKTRVALNADFDAESTRLMKAAPVIPVSKPLAIGPARKAIASRRDAEVAINAWTDEKVGKGMRYIDAFKASKTAEEMKEHWAVLNAPQAEA